MRGENRVRRCPECRQTLYFDYNTLSWTCTNPRCKKVYKYEESDEISITRGNETRHGRSRPHLEARTDNCETYQPDVHSGFKPSHGSSYGHRPNGEPRKKSRRVPITIGITIACIIAVVMFIILTDPFTPTLSTNPPAFSFSVYDGLNPPSQVLDIESSGRAITWFAIDDARWLNLDSIDGTTDDDTPVTLSVDLSGMYPGEYTATITIYASKAKNELIEIPASLVITETEETLAIKKVVSGSADDLEIYYDKQPLYGGFNLVNNPSATNPTWEQLIEFIASDATDQLTYIEDEYMCGNFAETLHNNAEQAGIRAAWVAIDFADNSVGHALNAFYTLATGLVFVDCTGGVLELAIPSSKESYNSDVNYDQIAYVKIGDEYGLIDVDAARLSGYMFYEYYEEQWEVYESWLEEYNERVDEYNSLVGGRAVIENVLEYMRLKAMYDQLEEERIELEYLAERLGDYWWEPLGIVSHVEVYW